MRPIVSAPPKSVRDRSPRRSVHRCAASTGERPTLASTSGAADIEQAAVLHARRARRLAIAAGQAAVEVELGLRGDRLAFQHLLHEVDAAARPVELVAQELVRRARRRAKAAMHARAQDGVGLAAFARVAILGGEVGLHQSFGNKTPAVENALRVEHRLQLPVQLGQRAVQGVEHIAVLVAAAELYGMPALRRGPDAAAYRDRRDRPPQASANLRPTLSADRRRGRYTARSVAPKVATPACRPFAAAAKNACV